MSTNRYDGCVASTFEEHLSKLLLERFILQCVNDRVYARVGEGRNDSEVVKCAREIDLVAQIKEEKRKLIPRVAYDVTHYDDH